MLMLPERLPKRVNGRDRQGNPLSRRGIGLPCREGKPSFGAQAQCANCGDLYWRTGFKTWHNAKCHKALRRNRDCPWCGESFTAKEAKIKCCSLLCAQRHRTYDTPKNHDDMCERAYQMLVCEGKSRKSTWTEMGTSQPVLRRMMERRCGPDAWAWLERRRIAISPVGFKGKGRKVSGTIAERMLERGSDVRMTTAKALRMHRAGTGPAEIAAVLGIQERSVPGSLRARSKVYARRSRTRRIKSAWSKREAAANFRSKLWPKESVFRDHVAKVLSRAGYECKVEEKICDGSRQRVDIFATKRGTSFAIEAKVTGRSSRADQCIGQAIRKGATMCARPVCVFPSDVKHTPEWLHGVSALGMTGIGLTVRTEEDIACMV